jgi:mono/diheme cytochrome c family protein
LLLSGCQQKMAKQPSYKPLEASSFFADGRSARPAIHGTVARGHLRTNAALFTGRHGPVDDALAHAAVIIGASTGGPLGGLIAAISGTGDFVTEFPIPVSEAVVQHGQNRYMIYCVVCHDPLGTGHGKIVERGYTRPPSYHIERLRHVSVGHLFAVITEGYGSMPSYGKQLAPRDRWAIVAYVRALQLSQHFPANRLPDEMHKHDESPEPGGQRR